MTAHTQAPRDLDHELLSIVRGVASAVGDLDTARTLPAEVYTSARFFEFERRAIFETSWLLLCHVDEVARPGDYLTVEIAGEPLVVTRDEQDRVHVLSAVCRHRGYVLVEGRGSTRHLRCPYHSWTYSLDGRLVGAPAMGEVHDLQELRATTCLPRLATEIWEGLVFVNFDTDPPPLAPTTGRLHEVLRPYRLAELAVADTMVFSGLRFNWKNMQENALEEYHTTYVHRGYHDNAPADMVRHGEYTPGDNGIYRYADLIIPGGQPVPGRPTFPVLDSLPQEYRWFFLFAAIPPTMFAVLRPDGVKLFSILPEAADRTTLRISFLFPRSTLELDDFESLMDRQRNLVELIDRPDLETNARTYRGLQSAFAPRGRYSPQERSLLQFNQWLLGRYTSELNPAWERM